jgi:hypothetical protein
MILMPAKRLTALAVLCAMFGIAQAQDPLPVETQLVGLSTAAVTTPTPPQTFTISSPEDLVVTLTDLQFPAELASAGVVVTQGGAIVGSGQLTAPATNASVSLPAASGVYTLYVFGVPGAGVSEGTFSVCSAPKASPSNCILQGAGQPISESPSISGIITAPNSSKDTTVSNLSTTLNVTTAGAYTFNFSDLAFPVALNTAPNLALFQGGTPIIPPGQTSPAITAGTSLALSPGTYTLLSIAQADQTVKQGLYSIAIVGPNAATPLVSTAVPVGLLSNPPTFSNPSAQNVTLTVADYGFPGPLASASAMLTAGGTVVGSASAAGGAQTLNAPAGTLTLWTYGSMSSTAGTFSADVSAVATDLYTTAQAVGPSGGTYTYAYVVPSPAINGSNAYTAGTPLAAGAYTATATDLQFPSQLGGLSFAVAQNGLILQQSTTATTLNFTATAGNAVVLVSATAPTSTTSPNGLFDVNVQSSGTSAALVYDQTQVVSAAASLFNTQTITVTDDASYDVTLTDLKFPEAFDSLALVVTRGSEVLGKVFGSGPFSFTGTPGTYTLTFVASPTADQQFGLYAASVVYSPPTVTLTSSAATAATGSNVTLTWSSTNATSCVGSGGGFTGSGTSGTASVAVAATTTYTMTCTGTGGSGTQTVTVTATAAASTSGGGGGGAIDPMLLIVSAGLLAARIRRGRDRTASTI